MASNPPFQVEDQSDEDFFDKLVNDDDDFKPTPPSGPNFTEPNFTDGNDSDETKAFANLSIAEAEIGFEDSGGEAGTEAKPKANDDKVKEVSPNNPVQESTNSSLVSSNSFEFDAVAESNSSSIATEVSSDPAASTSSGSTVSGVKEVQWSAFYSDSAQNGINGFGSYSDFFSDLGHGGAHDSASTVGDTLNNESKALPKSENSSTGVQHQDYASATEQIGDGVDMNSSEYWENLYPGWKYDTKTGQWYQVAGYDASDNMHGSSESNWAVSDGKSEVSYLQQSAQSFSGTLADNGTTESVTTSWNQAPLANETTQDVSNWNQVSQTSVASESVSKWNQDSQGNNGYPSHMIFDPQYPGWYYDSIAEEWRTLDTYNSSVQSTVQAEEQPKQNDVTSIGTSSHVNDNTTYSGQGFSSQGQDYDWAGSFNNSNQQGFNGWQPENVAKSESASLYGGNQQVENQYDPKFSTTNYVSQQKPYNYTESAPLYGEGFQGRNDFSEFGGSQGFVPGGNFVQPLSHPRSEKTEQMHVPNDYYGNLNPVGHTQKPFQNGHQFAPAAGRSPDGRPPHALAAFGFGGKLILMKNSGSLGNSSYASQDPAQGSISVLNLMEVVPEKADASTTGRGVCDYFHSLGRQSFPGPLTGGNVGSKELHKCIDERIANCESDNIDYRKGEVLRLLLSLLKIACQHYGKLRSPFGTDSSLKESDAPESAVARLFASAKGSPSQFSESSAFIHCLHKLPSEGQMRATAAEVQNLLVSGSKKEALQRAQDGQLWGPALVLAAQLGDQFYVDTVKQMALRQLVAGSPLRTLCLLIAGQPAEVFSTEVAAVGGVYGAVTMSQQPAQVGGNGMLDDWEENLAVIAANRTKDDELVLIHLGDCLWKERSEIVGAHICYLVAEANFEPYSDTARLCLLGADHWKFPRTYATPEAIQRTEIYEYSKVQGNSQFVLQSFQPYKLIYAHMLAEVGRVSEALKYCQAISKSLKTGRTPEVETCRQLVSSLEERIRTHQQGGFSANLAPGKLVGKLLNLFDSTAHRVVGGLPPPVPSASAGSIHGDEHNQQYMAPRVSTSQSTMAMSSLMPSASMEPISEWSSDGSRRTMHNRSVSEPDFGRTPRQADSSKDATSANGQGKTSGGTSRFRFGFGSQLLQKTVGLVLKSRQDRQAKLGDSNKFYYDEKLKRWVEEGVEPPPEEAAPPPPPTTAAFNNGMSDYSVKSALKSEGSLSNGSPEFKSPNSSEHSSGMPPIPPSSNQFSARGRMGVRSRYVDTFNQGGMNPTNLFQSPAVPSIKPTTATPKFFVPTPTPSSDQPLNTTEQSPQETTATAENHFVPSTNDSFHSHPPPPPPSSTIPRFGSMDNITNKGSAAENHSFSSYSRRTASWSGTFDSSSPPPKRTELKPLGEVLGMPPSSFMPTDNSLMQSHINGGSFGDELHEVEL